VVKSVKMPVAPIVESSNQAKINSNPAAHYTSKMLDFIYGKVQTETPTCHDNNDQDDRIVYSGFPGIASQPILYANDKGKYIMVGHSPILDRSKITVPCLSGANGNQSPQGHLPGQKPLSGLSKEEPNGPITLIQLPKKSQFKILWWKVY